MAEANKSSLSISKYQYIKSCWDRSIGGQADMEEYGTAMGE
jgi:hypothetical protein